LHDLLVLSLVADPSSLGILVFLTGQQEIVNLCKKLRTRFPMLSKSASAKEVAKEKASIEAESKTEAVSARNGTFA
jgi:HrpA-like RNA helicase